MSLLPHRGPGQTRLVGRVLDLAVVWFSVFWISSFSLVHAQPPDASPNWHAMRIFVPEDQVDSVVTPDYLTIKLETLERLLAREARKREQTATEDAGIKRAIYLARWNESQFKSITSLWQATFPGNQTNLEIGRTSLAIEEPQLDPLQYQALAPNLRYLDDSRLLLTANADKDRFWFGFSGKSRRGNGGQQFVDMFIPKASLSTMLIAVPSGAMVSSNLPCARIDDPQKFLPEDWPASAKPVLSPDEHWFVILLSGRDQCSLHLSPASNASRLPYGLSVASAQIDRLLDSAGMQVSAKFQLNRLPLGNSLQIRMEEPLRLRAVQVNGLDAASWRSLEEPVETGADPKLPPGQTRRRWNTVEIQFDASVSGPLLLAVDAIAPLRLPFSGTLPQVEIRDAYVLDGRGSLSCSEDVTLDDIQADRGHLTTPSNGSNFTWQWHWSGRAPRLTTRLRNTASPWVVRTLNRFNIQTEAIMATVNVQLTNSDVQGNQTTLKLARGWFIDSVELENAPPGVTANIRDLNAEASELVLRFDDPKRAIEMKLAINAHFPQRTEVERMRLQSPRILTLSGADQIDTYVLESSGRFQLEIDPELMRLRVRHEELPAWQRELVDRQDVWIFRLAHSSLPILNLRRARPTFSARLHTTIIDRDNECLIRYRVFCQPVSGSIDQFRLMLPLPPDAPAPTWSLVSDGDRGGTRGVALNSRATSSSTGETNFSLELSLPLSEPFQIESELRLPISTVSLIPGEFSVPLPGTPQAASQDAIVVIPESWLVTPTARGFELLPRGLCCGEDNPIDFEIDDSKATLVRYDPNLTSQLQLVRFNNRDKGAWVLDEAHEHWHYRHGTLHKSVWQIVSANPRTLEFHLPPEWQMHAVVVNGKPLEASNFTEQTLRVTIPQGNANTVALECSSSSPRSMFGSRILQEPTCGLSSLGKSRTAWFSNSELAFNRMPISLVDSWQARFVPLAWWNWLDIDPWSNTTLETKSETKPLIQEHFGNQSVQGPWWSMELDASQTTNRLWMVDRGLVTACLLSVALLLTSIFSWCCGRSVARWWSTWSLTLFALCVVPAEFVAAVQVVLVSLIVATLLAGCGAVIRLSKPAGKSRDIPTGISLLPSGRTATNCILFFLIAATAGKTTSAQPTSRSAQRDRAEIFGILIPVDSDFQVAGDYVYVPTRLSRLLSSAAQVDVKSSSVGVFSAFYSLRVSNDPSTMSTTVGELTAELSVQAPKADVDLQLQFAGRELQLQRAFLDSQEIFLGERLKQDNSQIMWRSQDADRHTLRLIFKPRGILERDGRGYLSVGVPAIPTAKLEIMGDDLRDVTVDTLGPSQLESPRFLTALMGPTNRLSLSWPLIVNRSATIQVQSDTWVHTHADQLIANCQIRIRGASGLPSVLHVVGDSNWMPVGEDWEDGRLLSGEGASATGRPVYSIERTASDQLTLRVLMLPRGDSVPPSISIPFLALQEASPQQRTLAISHAETPQWKQVGTESWPFLLASQSASIWEKGRLADQPTLLRVPAGTLVATLQKSVTTPQASVEESTEVSLQSPDIKLRYLARWSQPVVGEAAVRVQIPNGWRIDSAFVDSLPARHAIHRVPGKETGNEVVIFVGARGGIQALNLQMSTPARLNRAWRLPRPLLQQWKVTASSLQVLRGAELFSELNVLDQADIVFERTDTRSHAPLLQNLQTTLGRAELADRFRDAFELPVEIKLSRNPPNRQIQSVMRLERTDQGWVAQIDATVDAPQGDVNHLFFDIPNSLAAGFRDPIESMPMMLWPAADDNRTILCVLPQPGPDDKARVSLAVRLPAVGASQSVSIPDIRLTALGVSPVLALPNNVAGEEVRWTQVGRLLPDSWLESHGLSYLDLAGYSLYEAGASQAQAIWHSRKTDEQSSSVILTQALLKPSSLGGIAGEIDYWVDPGNQSSLQVQLPKDCELIGAQVSGETVHWTAEAGQGGHDAIRICMQPSYLPLQLRLHVRWFRVGPVLLPQPVARNLNQTIIGLRGLFTDGPSPWTARQREQQLEQVWASTLVQSAPTAANRQAVELRQWLSTWSPTSLGIDLSHTLPPNHKLLLPAKESNGKEDSQVEPETVSNFWLTYLRLLRVESWSDSRSVVTTNDKEIDSNQEVGQEVHWYRSEKIGSADPIPVSLERPQHNVLEGQRLAVGLIFVACSGLLWWVATRTLRKRLQSWGESIWPLWLALAAFSLVFLPIAWPGMLIMGGLIIVLWRRRRELRRDRQFVFAPRSSR